MDCTPRVWQSFGRGKAVGRSDREAPVPPWSTVAATTLRLWFQRHVLPRRERARPPGGVLIAGLVIALGAAAVGTEIAMAGDTAKEQPRHAASASPQAGPVPDAAVTGAARSRNLAAAWIAAQVSPGVIVSCDPLMCSALRQHGFPASNLEQLGAGSGDPLGSGIVVSTAAVRSQFGRRLDSVYAPDVIASFGAGAAMVQVRVIAPDGAKAQAAIEHSDLLARKAAGLQLLRNQNVHVRPAGRRQLAAGQVDSRLLITLTDLAHSFPVYVRQFGDSGPGAPAGAPLRSMTIAAWVRAGRRSPASYRSAVLAILRVQRAPLLARTHVVGTGEKAVLRIEFTAPSVPGLLGAQPPS